MDILRDLALGPDRSTEIVELYPDRPDTTEVSDNRKIELLEDVARAFRDIDPVAYAASILYAKRQREKLVTPTGMSLGGTWMYLGAVPPAVIKFIRTTKIRNFGRHPKDNELLFRVWSDLKIARERPKAYWSLLAKGLKREEKTCPQSQPV